MLILNLKEEKKKKTFFGKIQKSYTLDVSSFVCEKVVFNVVNLSIEDLGKCEVVSLLNRYKGLVLDTKNAEVNKKICNYLFDGQLYYKRAVVSSLASKLRFYESPSLCVLDDNFRFSSEWIEVARKCKNIVIKGNINIEINRFVEFCFKEYGLNVFVNENVPGDMIFIDFNSLNGDKSVDFTYKNTTEKLCPDLLYFRPNDSVNRLISLGVSKELACAALENIPYKRIYC